MAAKMHTTITSKTCRDSKVTRNVDSKDTQHVDSNDTQAVDSKDKLLMPMYIIKRLGHWTTQQSVQKLYRYLP